MSRTITTAVAVAAIFLLGSACLGFFAEEQWQYYKDINLGQASSGIAKVSLDEEIFSSASAGLSDLRIADGSNSEVPFKLTVGKEELKKNSFYPKLLNNSSIPGKNSSVILDAGEEGKIINQLRIDTPAENFQRNVIVSGGNTMDNLSVLKSNAYIYDYTDRKGNFKSQNTTLDFPDSAFRYLKIEIADPEGKSIAISRIEATNFTKSFGKEISRKPAYSVAENEQEKQTEIWADQGVKGVPVNKVRILASEKNFNRRVSIFSRDDNSNWQQAGSGYIFRYTTEKFQGENLSVAFPETNARYIKAVIRNGDDRPVGVSGIETFHTYREVVFQAEKNRSYRLFYGNKNAKWPEYDIEKYFKYLDVEKGVIANLSGQKNNPAYVPEKMPDKPLTERLPWLMSAALVVFSVGLLFLAYRFLKEKN